MIHFKNFFFQYWNLINFSKSAICQQMILTIFIVVALQGSVYSTPLRSISSSYIGEPLSDITISRLLNHAAQYISAEPHPLSRLHTEGTLPHQGIWDESVLAKRDFPLMRDAALAWKLSGDRRYLQQVDTFLYAWTNTYLLSYNPIDETNFDALIQAYMLTEEFLSPKTQESVQIFLRKMAEGYLTRMHLHQDESKTAKSFTWINNWQSHRIKLVTLSAVALKDPALIDQAHQLFLQQIADNIQPDGSVADFKDRDALHYVVYDLEPLIMAAMAARCFNNKNDWLHEKSATHTTLANAIDWLIPYADGTKTHEEFVHSHVAFDRKRADAGVHGFAGIWEPRTASSLFALAAQLDAKYHPLAEKLATAAPPSIHKPIKETP